MLEYANDQKCGQMLDNDILSKNAHDIGRCLIIIIPDGDNDQMTTDSSKPIQEHAF